MKQSSAFASRFYLPLLISLLLLSLVIFTPQVLSVSAPAALEAEIKIAIIGIKIPLTTFEQSATVVKASVLAVAALLLAYGLNIDFSRYFPQRLKLNAYFDTPGMERILATFSPKQLNQLEISEDWKQHIAEYDNDVVSSLKGVWQQQGLTDPWPKDESPRSYFQCSGETTFVVERKGLLTYKVTEAKGDLAYVADFPRLERKIFRGLFNLRDTSASYIRPNLIDLIKSPSVLIAPQFMQVFRTEAWNEAGSTGPFEHILVAATKVTLLPVPSFGDTVYLWKMADGKWIPVSYCVYHASAA